MTLKQQLKIYYPWLIWLLGALFFFLEYVARVSPSVMKYQLMTAFQSNAMQFGLLSAAFSVAYIGLQIPVGILVDYYSPKRLLAVMATLCGVACLLFATSHLFAVAVAGRLLMGIAAAFAFIGTLKLATQWFPGRRFGLLAGLTQAVGMLGAATGAGIMAITLNYISWRVTISLIGGALLLLALTILVVVRDKPQHNNSPKAHKRSASSILWHLKAVVTQPQAWLNGLFAGLLYAPTSAFAELWGVSYLQRVHHLSTDVSASAISMIFIGWAIGGPIFGWLSDTIRRRKPVILGSAVLSLIFILFILYSPHLSTHLLFTLLFLYGFSNIGVSTAYAIASEMVPQSIAGISMSFTNMASVILGMAFQPIIGYLLDRQWQGQMLHGERLYSAHAYLLAVTVLPACLVISIVVALFVKETHCQKREC